jgi:hypothetical protein
MSYMSYKTQALSSLSKRERGRERGRESARARASEREQDMGHRVKGQSLI